MVEIQHIKLSELTLKIKEVLTNAFELNEYWIVAEISSHKFYPNNDRHYFEFIEKEEGSNDPIAKIRGVSWRLGSEHIKSFEQATGQVFSNGIEVLAKVKVEFHQSHGLQLILQNIDPTFTLGNIEKQRRDTLHRLLSENKDTIELVGEEYVTRNKKLDFNPTIQNLAIIGSPNSEGYTDFIDTVNKN
ncbi:MAG: exodeoxyribonuclease VII large subunit [Cyclobacteriaceae bacterium]|nr:exodeoxyribonuclease VII large subunit [Cyclobacteriaceae bacterium]